jgi:hypothetical protein
MPGSATVPRGNELFNQVIQALLTPPTVTTGVVTNATYTIAGLAAGDLISWNQLTFVNNLVTATNMTVLAANTLTVSWTTEGATQSGVAAIPFLLEVVRPENYVEFGLAAIPTSIF